MNFITLTIISFVMASTFAFNARTRKTVPPPAPPTPVTQKAKEIPPPAPPADGTVTGVE
jgi:hypothetical protein